jgi:hypothetical protein
MSSEKSSGRGVTPARYLIRLDPDTLLGVKTSCYADYAFSLAWAAANRATGTRGPEQET